MRKIKSLGNIHPWDWRNFRVKKHWFGIHHFSKKIRKQINTTMRDDIEISVWNDTNDYGNKPNIRKKMRYKARYQTWEWYLNNQY